MASFGLIASRTKRKNQNHKADKNRLSGKPPDSFLYVFRKAAGRPSGVKDITDCTRLVGYPHINWNVQYNIQRVVRCNTT